MMLHRLYSQSKSESSEICRNRLHITLTSPLVLFAFLNPVFCYGGCGFRLESGCYIRSCLLLSFYKYNLYVIMLYAKMQLCQPDMTFNTLRCLLRNRRQFVYVINLLIYLYYKSDRLLLQETSIIHHVPCHHHD